MTIRKILRIIQDILPYIFFAVITFLVFGNTLFLPSTKLLSNGDLMGYDYYIFSFLRQSLARGEFPWWNPHTFSGVPFLANPYMNLFYLPKWILVILPFTVSFSWYMAIHIWLAMAGMYWFLKHYLHKSPSIVGALAFGLSGHVIGHVFNGDIDVISATAWMPITMGTIIAAVRKPNYRKTIIAGIICAIQLISGHQTMTLYIFETLSILIVIMAIVKKTWVPLILFPLVIGIAAGLAAVQIIPVEQFIARSIRTYPKFTDWYYYGSLKPQDLRTLVIPFIYGAPNAWLTGIGDWLRVLYFGIIPLCLAVYGFLIWCLGTVQKKTTSLFGTKEIWLIPSLCFISLITLWVAFGNTVSVNLQDILIRYLPWYQYIRTPSNHLTITTLCLAIVAGFGLESLLRIRKQWALGIGLLAIILTSADLILFGSRFMIVWKAPDLRADHEIINAVQNSAFPQNRQYNDISGYDLLTTLEHNSPLEYNQYAASGYDISDLRSYYSFINATNHTQDFFTTQEIQINPPSQAINFLNIQYLLYPSYDYLNYPVKLINPQKNYILYENPDVLPRFFILPAVINVSSRDEAYNQISTDSVDLSKTVILIGKHNLPHADCQSPNYNGVIVTSYRANSITLHVNSPCSGWLVSSEVMFPGWQAFIDGKRTTLYEGNLAFRTIFVPQGSHIVVYTFFPSVYLLGAAVSLTTLVFLIFWLKFSSKQKVR